MDEKISNKVEKARNVKEKKKLTRKETFFNEQQFWE